MKTLETIHFGPLVRAAVGEGLDAAGVLDVGGKFLAVTGALDEDEKRAIAAVVKHYMRRPDDLRRMLDAS